MNDAMGGLPPGRAPRRSGHAGRLAVAGAAGGFLVAAAATLWWEVRKAGQAQAPDAAGRVPDGDPASASADAVAGPPPPSPYSLGRSVGRFRAVSPGQRRPTAEPQAARGAGRPRPRRRGLRVVAAMLLLAVVAAGVLLTLDGGLDGRRAATSPRRSPTTEAPEGDRDRPPPTLAPVPVRLGNPARLPAGSGRGGTPGRPDQAGPDSRDDPAR